MNPEVYYLSVTKEEEIKHYEKLVLAYAHKHYPVYRNRTSVGIIEVKEDRILFGMRGVQGVLVLSKEALRESLEGDSKKAEKLMQTLQREGLLKPSSFK